MNWINPTKCGVILQVKVQARASKNEIAGINDNSLKIRLTAPPVEGEANKLLQKFLGGIFNCAIGNIKILKGQKNRTKLVEITGVTADEVIKVVKNRQKA